ncbi:MAG TPA: DedA family protein [Candidatus Avirikenella pullistercoris]|nr:DedA family protein [Candidatus Avirikenella pullistercoris]
MEALLNFGYIGLFIGAFLAATIIPFSSDVLLVGLLAAGGDPIISITVATLGNWLGGLSSYWLGYIGKWEWLEKYFKVKPETLEKQKKKVDKYGASLAFFSWLPGIGDVLAIALGFYRVDFKKSAVFMLIGKGARFIAWGVIVYYVKPLFA